MKRYAILLLALAGCDQRAPRPVSSDGVRHAAVLPAPAGAVARGAAAERAALRAAPADPAAGAAGFRTFCQPCHGATGDGDGPVTARGFTRPRPLATVDRSPTRVVTVISRGYGAMLPMADQITPAQRWAIARHVARERP